MLISRLQDNSIATLLKALSTSNLLDLYVSIPLLIAPKEFPQIFLIHPSTVTTPDNILLNKFTPAVDFSVLDAFAWIFLTNWSCCSNTFFSFLAPPTNCFIWADSFSTKYSSKIPKYLSKSLMICLRTSPLDILLIILLNNDLLSSSDDGLCGNLSMTPLKKAVIVSSIIESSINILKQQTNDL